jgi:hypothetical protein
MIDFISLGRFYKISLFYDILWFLWQVGGLCIAQIFVKLLVLEDCKTFEEFYGCYESTL